MRPPAHPDKPIRGSDAVVDWLRPDSFDRQRYEIRELRENEDRVFIELEFVGRGRASGIELRQPAWVVYEYEGELVRRMTTYSDRVAALEAAGLPS